MAQILLLKSPYRDIHQFRYVDRDLFFGREQEIEDLVLKVMLYRVVVLFGGSGAGKSSLINAGLIPALENQGLAPERLLVRPNGPILVQRAIVNTGGEFLSSKVFPAAGEERTTGELGVVSYSIEAFQSAVRDAASRVRPVLIFDQFEELFTLFDEKYSGLQEEIRSAIFSIIADSQLRAKVVISVREDFFGRLEVLAKDYPRVFEQRLRVEALSKESARRAILGPFGDPLIPKRPNPFPSRLTEELADRYIIPQLSYEPPAGRIHPTQLQIVCERVWQAFSKEKQEIGKDDFELLGQVNGILENYLAHVLEKIEKSPEKGYPSIRRQDSVMVLRNLVIDSKYRDVVSESRLEAILVDTGMIMSVNDLKNVLEVLEHHRLINRTPRAGTFYCDIASEYLIPAIQREAKEVDAQLAIEREEKRLREEAERGAQAKVEKDLRRRLGWAWTFGALTALCVVAAASFALWTWQLSNQLSTSLEKERSLGVEKDVLMRKIHDSYEDQRELTKQLEYANRTLAKEKSTVENERTKAISNELGQRALNKLSEEPASSLLLALQSVLVARQVPQQPTNTKNQGDPEAHGTFQRVSQTLVSRSRLLFERALSKELSKGKIDRVMRFSADGKRLATGGDDGVVRVWDAVHGQLLLTLESSDSTATRVLDVAFTPNGQTVMAVGSDSLIRAWNTRSGEPELEPGKVERDQITRGQATRVDHAVLADDGRRYSVIASDGGIRVWELTDRGRRPLQVKGKTKDDGVVIQCPESKVSMSPNGELFACVDRSGVVKIHSPFGERQIPERQIRTGYESTKMLIFSPDSQGIVVINTDGRFALFNVTANRLIWEKSHQGVTAASFGQDGRFFATASRDGTVQFLDARTGKLLHLLPAEIGSVVSFIMSPDGRRIAAAGESGSTKLWEFPLAGYRDGATSLALSSDGRKIALGTRAGTVRVAFVSSGRELVDAWLKKAAALSLAFSPDANRLAIGFEDGSASILDIWSGKQITGLQRQKIERNPVHSIAFSPDGTRVATGDELGNIEVWDAETGKRYIHNDDQAPEAIYSIAFDREGTRLVTGNQAGVAVIFDTKSRKIVSATGPVVKKDPSKWVAGPEEITKVAFAKDGKHFMAIRRTSTKTSATERSAAEVWTEQRGLAKLQVSVPPKTKDSNETTVIGAAFRQDGKLITVAGNGAVQTWSTTGGNRQDQQTLMEGIPGGGNVVFDQSGRIFAIITKADAIGMFTFEQDLALEWALMQLTQAPDDGACTRYEQSMAETCLQVAKVLGLVANANGQLKKRNWPQAIATYEKAQRLYPALPKDLSARLKRPIAEMLLVEGRDMARVGNDEGGLATLRDARRYDPGLMSDPAGAFKRFSAWLRDDKNQILADLKTGQGEREAKRGDLEATIKYFREAMDLNPNVFRSNDLEAEAKRLVARTNFELGTKAAREGKLEEAIRYFTDAKNNDPNLFKDRTPELEAKQNIALGRINRGVTMARAGQTIDALQQFREAQEIDANIRISAESWNSLCWDASLNGDAAAVVDDACKNAVELDPNNGAIRDSRGVARAIVGRLDEALEDFRYFVQQSSIPAKYRTRRQRWIEQILQGTNPLVNPDEIEELKLE
jgi:WD40 repeat protein/tetratricopeptide (TPR) repeat protein